MCRLNILFFSTLRQKIGAGQLALEFAAPLTGAQLLDDLAARYDVVAEYRAVVRLAVNQEYVQESVSLADGDEVALITPVSGG